MKKFSFPFCVSLLLFWFSHISLPHGAMNAEDRVLNLIPQSLIWAAGLCAGEVVNVRARARKGEVFLTKQNPTIKLWMRKQKRLEILKPGNYASLVWVPIIHEIQRKSKVPVASQCSQATRVFKIERTNEYTFLVHKLLK